MQCGWDEDSLYHYGRCGVFWRFLADVWGIPLHHRSAESFLLLGKMDEEQKVKVAKGIYALHRTVQFLRQNIGVNANPLALLKLFAACAS